MRVTSGTQLGTPSSTVRYTTYACLSPISRHSHVECGGGNCRVGSDTIRDNISHLTSTALIFPLTYTGSFHWHRCTWHAYLSPSGEGEGVV